MFLLLPGLYAGEFFTSTLLNIAPTAYSSALSGACTATGTGYAGLFYNPALLLLGKRNELNFAHIFWIDQTYFNNFSLKMDITGNVAAGMSFLFFSSGDMPRSRDINSSLSRSSSGLWSAATGEVLRAGNFSFVTGAAYNLKVARLHMLTGLNIKISKAGIDNNAVRSLLFDAGLLFPLAEYLPEKINRYSYLVPCNISLVLYNIGFAKSSLPSARVRSSRMELTTGLGFSAWQYKKYSLEYELALSTREGFLMSTRHRFDIYKYIKVNALAGFRFINRNISFSSGLNFILHLRGFDYNITYAMNTLPQLGITHNLDFSVKSDYDIIYKLFGNRLDRARKNKRLQEVMQLINEGRYKAAYVLIKMLRRKFPEDKYIASVFKRMEEIADNNDLFFY